MMPVVLGDLIRHGTLGIVPVTEGQADVAVSWAHSSDLADPTPFLEPGHMVLTTGTQFGLFGPQEYRAYVRRLIRAGVAAVGFGTEVVRSGTPIELIGACEAAHLPLVEVPYATPFIAVSKYIADQVAADSRRQLEWTLSSQESISRAVIESGGLTAAIRRAAERLACSIAVLNADGMVLEGEAPPWLQEHGKHLLARGRRARDRGEEPGRAWRVQTLGKARRLLGAVTLHRTVPFDASEQSVITMLVALTELSLEHAEDQRLGFRSIARQMLALLRDGEVEAVREALYHHSARLPSEPYRVLAIATAELESTVRASLERMATGRQSRLFAVEDDGMFFLIADPAALPHVQARLEGLHLRAGLSSPSPWTALSEAIGQATSALSMARRGRTMAFDELVKDHILGLLGTRDVADLARIRLGAVLAAPNGAQLLSEASTWFRHNCAWDPASRELGMHRHTLRQHIEELGRLSNIALDDFQGRAELWALITAANAAADTARDDGLTSSAGPRRRAADAGS